MIPKSPLIVWNTLCLASLERANGSPILNCFTFPWKCRASSPAFSSGSSNSISLQQFHLTRTSFWQYFSSAYRLPCKKRGRNWHPHDSGSHGEGCGTSTRPSCRHCDNPTWSQLSCPDFTLAPGPPSSFTTEIVGCWGEALWRACIPTAFLHSLTGPVGQPFASHHEGQPCSIPRGVLMWNLIPLLELSRYIFHSLIITVHTLYIIKSWCYKCANTDTSGCICSATFTLTRLHYEIFCL